MKQKFLILFFTICLITSNLCLCSCDNNHYERLVILNINVTQSYRYRPEMHITLRSESGCFCYCITRDIGNNFKRGDSVVYDNVFLSNSENKTRVSIFKRY